MKERVDNLSEACQGVGIKVENANNAFLSLSNTQFIENRVYDEDPSSFVESDEQEVNREIGFAYYGTSITNLNVDP